MENYDLFSDDLGGSVLESLATLDGDPSIVQSLSTSSATTPTYNNAQQQQNYQLHQSTTGYPDQKLEYSQYGSQDQRMSNQVQQPNMAGQQYRQPYPSNYQVSQSFNTDVTSQPSTVNARSQESVQYGQYSQPNQTAGWSGGAYTSTSQSDYRMHQQNHMFPPGQGSAQYNPASSQPQLMQQHHSAGHRAHMSQQMPQGYSPRGYNMAGHQPQYSSNQPGYPIQGQPSQASSHFPGQYNPSQQGVYSQQTSAGYPQSMPARPGQPNAQSTNSSQYRPPFPSPHQTPVPQMSPQTQPSPRPHTSPAMSPQTSVSLGSPMPSHAPVSVGSPMPPQALPSPRSSGVTTPSPRSNTTPVSSPTSSTSATTDTMNQHPSQSSLHQLEQMVKPHMNSQNYIPQAAGQPSKGPSPNTLQSMKSPVRAAPSPQINTRMTSPHEMLQPGITPDAQQSPSPMKPNQVQNLGSSSPSHAAGSPGMPGHRYSFPGSRFPGSQSPGNSSQFNNPGLLGSPGKTLPSVQSPGGVVTTTTLTVTTTASINSTTAVSTMQSPYGNQYSPSTGGPNVSQLSTPRKAHPGAAGNMSAPNGQMTQQAMMQQRMSQSGQVMQGQNQMQMVNAQQGQMPNQINYGSDKSNSNSMTGSGYKLPPIQTFPGKGNIDTVVSEEEKQKNLFESYNKVTDPTMPSMSSQKGYSMQNPENQAMLQQQQMQMINQPQGMSMSTTQRMQYPQSRPQYQPPPNQMHPDQMMAHHAGMPPQFSHMSNPQMNYQQMQQPMLQDPPPTRGRGKRGGRGSRGGKRGRAAKNQNTAPPMGSPSHEMYGYNNVQMYNQMDQMHMPVERQIPGQRMPHNFHQMQMQGNLPNQALQNMPGNHTAMNPMMQNMSPAQMYQYQQQQMSTQMQMNPNITQQQQMQPLDSQNMLQHQLQPGMPPAPNTYQVPMPTQENLQRMQLPGMQGLENTDISSLTEQTNLQYQSTQDPNLSLSNPLTVENPLQLPSNTVQQLQTEIPKPPVSQALSQQLQVSSSDLISTPTMSPEKQEFQADLPPPSPPTQFPESTSDLGLSDPHESLQESSLLPNHDLQVPSSTVMPEPSGPAVSLPSSTSSIAPQFSQITTSTPTNSESILLPQLTSESPEKSSLPNQIPGSPKQSSIEENIENPVVSTNLESTTMVTPSLSSPTSMVDSTISSSPIKSQSQVSVPTTLSFNSDVTIPVTATSSTTASKSPHQISQTGSSHSSAQQLPGWNPLVQTNGQLAQNFQPQAVNQIEMVTNSNTEMKAEMTKTTPGQFNQPKNILQLEINHMHNQLQQLFNQPQTPEITQKVSYCVKLVENFY